MTEKNTELDLIPKDKLTTRDKIFSWYMDTTESIVLSEKEVKIQKRWATAYTMMCNHKSPEKVKNFLIKTHNISEAQAYRDIRASVSLFGDVGASDNKGFAHILFEMAMTTFTKAKKGGNLNQMNKAIANMIIIKGIGKDDLDLPDFAMFEPHEVKIDVPEEVLTLFTKLVSTGAVDITKLMQQVTQDIDHEEIS